MHTLQNSTINQTSREKKHTHTNASFLSHQIGQKVFFYQFSHLVKLQDLWVTKVWDSKSPEWKDPPLFHHPPHLHLHLGHQEFGFLVLPEMREKVILKPFTFPFQSSLGLIALSQCQKIIKIYFQKSIHFQIN